MLHPLSQPLDELTSEEIDKKYSDLMNRYHIARRMNMGDGVMNQLDLLLSSIETEKYRRAMGEEKPNGVVLETDALNIKRE